MLLASLEFESGADNAINEYLRVTLEVTYSTLAYAPSWCEQGQLHLYWSRKRFMTKNNPIINWMTGNSALTVSLYSNVATLIKENKSIMCSVY